MISQTFNVEENKVPSVVFILPQGLRYSHLLIFYRPHHIDSNVKLRKLLYLSPLAKIYKTKSAELSQIFKVEENKVFQLFSIWPQGLISDMEKVESLPPADLHIQISAYVKLQI